MEFHVVTLFPEMFASPFAAGIAGRAARNGLLTIQTHDLRPYGLGNYRQVDDTPYGGGSGMVMRPEPIAAAVDQVTASHPGLWKVLLTPQGQLFRQSIAAQYARQDRGLLLVCGRYEGVDERVRGLVDQELSVGDFVLSGGELAAMVVIEAVVRLLPGVLGNVASLEEESFARGLLEYPQYTRPEVFRGERVPEILLSGDHERISRWRQEQALQRTAARRPDLLAGQKLRRG